MKKNSKFFMSKNSKLNLTMKILRSKKARLNKMSYKSKREVEIEEREVMLNN